MHTNCRPRRRQPFGPHLFEARMTDGWLRRVRGPRPLNRGRADYRRSRDKRLRVDHRCTAESWAKCLHTTLNNDAIVVTFC